MKKVDTNRPGGNPIPLLRVIASHDLHLNFSVLRTSCSTAPTRGAIHMRGGGVEPYVLACMSSLAKVPKKSGHNECTLQARHSVCWQVHFQRFALEAVLHVSDKHAILAQATPFRGSGITSWACKVELLEEFAGLLDQVTSAPFSKPGVFFGQWWRVTATKIGRIYAFVPIWSETKSERRPGEVERAFF